MADTGTQIRRIEGKLQQLIKKCRSLQQENASLKKNVEGKNAELRDKSTRMAGLEEKDRLRKLVAHDQPGLDQTDKKELQVLINEYIKEIDHCIAGLND